MEDSNEEMEGRERLLRTELDVLGDVCGRLREEVGVLRGQLAKKERERERERDRDG